ncbi:MAG: VacJ family lipoprotein [Nitrospira sp.]
MGTDQARMSVGLHVFVGALLLSGCTTWSSPVSGGDRSSAVVLSDGPTLSVIAPSAPVILVANSPASADGTAVPPDEPFDPFAKSGEGPIEEYDPWEPVNAKVFEFNRQVDRWVLKPVAKAYDAVVPNPVQIGVSNVFANIRFPSRFLNNIFQGKIHGAGTELGRFLLNSTFGLGGVYDVAKDMNITTPEEDTGQTLGFYGVKPGPYVVLPLLPPFNARDLVGFVGDIALNPINWMVAPIIEVQGIPSVIAHKNRMTSTSVQLGGRVFEILNDRSLNLEKFQGVEEATLDLYTAVRNAYLQKRARAIQE